MFHIALFQPEIPPNTGNIIRLCANAGATLHLIHPLGFSIDEPRLRRAGLDYHELTCIREHASLSALLAQLPQARLLTFSTRGRRRHDQIEYREGDLLLFGPETRGLPAEILDDVPPDQRLRLPMYPGNRSLNLSNAVAVALYEAWRQFDFAGAADPDTP